MPKNKQITRSAPAKTLKFVNKTLSSETANNSNKLNKTPTKKHSAKDKVFATQPKNSTDNSNTTLRRSSRRFARPNVNPENKVTSDKDVQSNTVNNNENTNENEEHNDAENEEASVASLSQKETETENTPSQEDHTDNSNDTPRRSLRFNQSNLNPYDRGIESIVSKVPKNSKSKKNKNKDSSATEESESNQTEADSTHQEETEDGNTSPEEDHLDGELDFGNDDEEIVESTIAVVNDNEEVENPAQETSNKVTASVTTINRTKRKYISKNVPKWAKATNGETVSWDSQESETNNANQPNKVNNNVIATQADDTEEEDDSEAPGSPIIGQINAFEHLLDFDPNIWSQDQVDYLKNLCLKTKFDRELIFRILDSLRINPLEQFLKNDIKLKINEFAEEVLKVYLSQSDNNTTKTVTKANATNNQKPATEEQSTAGENEELSRPNSTTPRTPENGDQESINEESIHNTNNSSPQINTKRSARIRSRSRASVQSDPDSDYDSDTNTIVAIVPSKKKQKPIAKKFWTEAENAALEQGILKHGCNWRQILDDNIIKGDKSLINRTNINLKDRARSEKARRIKCGLDLGVYDGLVLNVDSLLPKHLKEYN